MAFSLALPPELCNQLEYARKTLGLSQERLAEMARLSQANVSNCLKGRAVRIDSLLQLLGAFSTVLPTAAERGTSEDEVQRLREIVDSARKLVESAVETPLYLPSPGGAIPENAVNRIRRPEDQQLLAALTVAPFTAAVTGPPHCGKSTLLQLLASEARRSGFTVTQVDAVLMPNPKIKGQGESKAPGGESAPEEEDTEEKEKTEEALSKKFFSELAEEVGRTIDQRPTETVDSRFALMRFLREARLRRSTPPLLIIVDHTASISLAFEELVQVCRSLDPHKSRIQISWAIETSDQPVGAPLGALSRLSPFPLVNLSWFTKEQVQELGRHYQVEDQSQLTELRRWFSGQPFLTHAALARYQAISASSAEEPWEELISELKHGGSVELEKHLRRIRHWVELSYPKLIEQLRQQKNEEPSDLEKLWRFVTHSVDKEYPRPEFYKLHLFRGLSEP